MMWDRSSTKSLRYSDFYYTVKTIPLPVQMKLLLLLLLQQL